MSKNLKIDGLELSGVDTIEAYDTDSKEYAKFVDTDDANAEASNISKGKTAYVGSKKVVGTYTPPTQQEKSVEITANGTTNVTPDAGNVLSKVIVETNVPATPTEEKTVDLSMASGNRY